MPASVRCSADISPVELRRAGLRAMGEVAARLGARWGHVVFGHTHRPGRCQATMRASGSGAAGAELVNSGSWTYSAIFLTARTGESPYWPGCSVLVPESGDPQVLRMLQDFTHEQLAPGLRTREHALT